MKRVYLDGNDWKLKNERIGEVHATVPGCVHTDLLSCGKIKDYFWRDNALSARWIEDLDWEYSRVFSAQTGEKVKLVFEGLDTYAEVLLNGKHIGNTDNMFIRYEFDVTNILEKENRLTVVFKSPIKAVEDMPKREGAFTSERINTRRIQCTYGWDWVDRFVTCGIFRSVYLRYEDDMFIDNIYVATQSVDSFGAQIYTELSVKNHYIGNTVKIEILSPEGETVNSAEFYCREPLIVRRFDIKNPRLWYPCGYGEHPLYTIKVTVGNNVIKDTFGIRTLKIIQLDDEKGSEYYNIAKEFQNTEIGKIYSFNDKPSGFQVVVNGIPVFCKGANWVPCEPFPSAESGEKIGKIIKMFSDIGGNFIRVWGGGVFERDEFYYECDKNGILLAQDFLMACGTYPEKEKWFIDALKRESEYAVKKLRNHPSLAWWHGDNENAQWGNDTLEDYRGRDSALKGIAENVYKYDIMRQFLPSSPYGGNVFSSATKGTAHTTMYCSVICGFFKDCKGDEYKEFLSSFTARFISEEPIFGALSLSSLRRFLTEDDIFCDDTEEMMRFHTKTNSDFPDLYDDVKSFCEKVFGKFQNAADRLFKYRYLGYEWLRVVFENYRRSIGYCNGVVFWMLDDCWPAAVGWALIDYYNIPKSSYYSFKRNAKSVTCSIKEEGKYRFYVSNDSLTDKDILVKAHLFDLKDNKITDTFETKICSKSYSANYIELPWLLDNSQFVVGDIEYDGQEDRCFYKRKNLEVKNCDYLLEIEKSKNSVKIKADGYVHVVELDGDYIFSDNYFIMLPGETKTVMLELCEGAQNRDISVCGYTL